MELREFWEGIKLQEHVIKQVFERTFEEEEYLRLQEVYCKCNDMNYEPFLKEVRKKEKSELWFLFIYSRMACETYEKYKKCGIADKIYWDTFQDIRFWCENYEREFGCVGLGAQDWFPRLVDMTLFRLGRLQFEKMDLEYAVGEGKDYMKKGTPVINIHVPQGEPLIWEACEESLELAYEFYGKERPYVCHSWILFPGLEELLSEKSNMREFRKHFRVIRVDFNEREAEWRIFGKVNRIVSAYPTETRLQKCARDYLLSGKVLGNGWAVLE